eukprot:498665-Amphidinium_carterae.2
MLHSYMNMRKLRNTTQVSKRSPPKLQFEGSQTGVVRSVRPKACYLADQKLLIVNLLPGCINISVACLSRCVV